MENKFSKFRKTRKLEKTEIKLSIFQIDVNFLKSKKKI